ncbi:MAG TPA: hypothetical protein VF729_03535 [Solirubrobacterales bacterium]
MQFEFAGTLGVAPGRYLAREGGESGPQSVLVVETLGAPATAGRRRRQAREVDPEAPLPDLPLTRATAIRAFEPFDSAEEATGWLEDAIGAEEKVDALVAEGIGLLNRALHAQATASADPHGHELAPAQALQVLVGVGSGEEVATGRFSQAREVDVRGGASRRQRREAELRPQERVAAVLGGREQIDACETLLLRARADLDAGRLREAALQLRVGLEALLAELAGALADPDHEQDMAELEARRQQAGEAANMALRGELDASHESNVRELTELCERVLRRRRILRG